MIVLKDGKPFQGEHNLDRYKVAQIERLGIWTAKEWADRGLELAVPFDCPAGFDVVGEPRYAKDKGGVWRETYDVVAEPAPKVITPTEQLELKTGLTVAQIKEVLR